MATQLDQYQDITVLWQQAHAHLMPQPGAIMTGASESLSTPPDLRTCPACQQTTMLQVACDIKWQQQGWQHKAKVWYCTDCHRVYWDQKTEDRGQRTEDTRGVLQTPRDTVIQVNARLWLREPVFLNIEPTTRCNFECWYCIGRSMNQGDITVENFAKALKHFPQMRLLGLVGEGEPFLHKGFFKMAKMAIDQGVIVATITNGSTLSQSIVEKICHTGVHYVSVSIDSMNTDFFAQNRIKGKLDKVLHGIERLRQYRDQHQLPYPLIGLKGTLLHANREELVQIVEKMKVVGIDVFEGFQTLNKKQSYIDIYPANKHIELDKLDAVNQSLQQSLAYLQKQNYFHLLTWDEFLARHHIPLDKIRGTDNGIRKGCDEHWLYSLFSGDITPCCQIKQTFTPKWNLFEHPLDDILSNPTYENLRFNLYNGFFLPQCQGCYKT